MTILIAIILTLILQIVTPFWWWVMLVPFITGFARSLSGWGAFRMGVATGGSVWFFAGLVLLMSKSQVIAWRIAQTAGVRNGWIVLMVTTLIAMLAAGIASATGYSLRVAFRPAERD